MLSAVVSETLAQTNEKMSVLQILVKEIFFINLISW